MLMVTTFEEHPWVSIEQPRASSHCGLMVDCLFLAKVGNWKVERKVTP
jgi:hypothetical protein